MTAYFTGVAKDDDEFERLAQLGEFLIAQMREEEQPSLFSVEQMAKLATESRHHKARKRGAALSFTRTRVPRR